MAELRSIFAPQIYLAQHPGASRINPGIRGFVQELAATDTENQAACAEGYNPHGIGFTSYFEDRTERILAHPAMQELLSFVVKSAIDCMRAMQFELGRQRIGIDRIWANVNPPGSYHLGHLHGQSVLSGTYYVQVPEGSEGGELVFEDPLEAHRMAEPHRPSDPGRKIAPAAGLLVLFPSWLRHEVKLQRAQGDRVSLSFNCFAR